MPRALQGPEEEGEVEGRKKGLSEITAGEQGKMMEHRSHVTRSGVWASSEGSLEQK